MTASARCLSFRFFTEKKWLLVCWGVEVGVEGGEDVFPFVLESLVGDTGGDLVSPSCLRMANWDMFFVL